MLQECMATFSSLPPLNLFTSLSYDQYNVLYFFQHQKGLFGPVIKVAAIHCQKHDHGFEGYMYHDQVSMTFSTIPCLWVSVMNECDPHHFKLIQSVVTTMLLTALLNQLFHSVTVISTQRNTPNSMWLSIYVSHSLRSSQSLKIYILTNNNL